MTELYPSIETPALIIDESVVLTNIKNFQQHCEQVGLSLRPHIKTHKIARFAQHQINAGAKGITCQKIGEAEQMADAGIEDILITYNIIGDAKIARLKALINRIKKLSVTADNQPVIAGLSTAFADHATQLTVLIECDTGGGRCGVQSPSEAVELARAVSELPGLVFGGLMTYPKPGGSRDAARFMSQAVAELQALGLACSVVSTGGSPDMWGSQTHGVFTEYRIGTYIYNDRSLLARGTCQQSNCAAYVLATVVSTPTAERAIIDAGSKVLTTDLFGLTGHGLVVDHGATQITALSEEHGTLSQNPAGSLSVGERIRILPNHICVVSNMFDSVWVINPSGKLERLRVDARGRVL